MSISRRDFMKLVGVSVASLALTRCIPPIGVTCYAPLPPSPYPTDLPLSARDRLRRCWLSFGELAQATVEESNQGISENTFGQELVAEHRLALDELVTSGALTASVADLVQEAYGAAVYHIWRSNAPMTCYEPMIVDYAPVSAAILVQQSDVLGEIADESTIDPETLTKAQAALEHDMAFYALTDEEVSALYERLVTEWQSQQAVPAFEDLELEITPDAQAAAQFIINLLTGQ
ncbi:MAG: twin-arginine translocation signal domain-containing protein [Chloroflexi bacterium]|nr:twin-arginine translocation signal domain-containing protein [Chloroflexota bacterium]